MTSYGFRGESRLPSFVVDAIRNSRQYTKDRPSPHPDKPSIVWLRIGGPNRAEQKTNNHKPSACAENHFH